MNIDTCDMYKVFRTVDKITAAACENTTGRKQRSKRSHGSSSGFFETGIFDFPSDFILVRKEPKQA